MRGLTVQPGVANSIELTELPEVRPSKGDVLLEALALGICGTDREIIAAEYGEAPKGDNRLVLGHESLARVLEAPSGSGLAPGDLVVPIVRRPDPVPCPNCAVGEWDMCRNGRYTEHGIKSEHGFGAEQLQLEPNRLVKLDPALGANGVLLEPASVLAKAWEHIERIGQRARWTPERVLVTGAGPIGLLAALMARQRGLEVHVLDIVKEGPKPRLVQQLGATYHSDGIDRVAMIPDVTLECTGVASLVIDTMCQSAHGGITCLTGVSSGGRKIEVDMASVATDEPPRDAYFRGDALEVGTYPTATFALTSPVELPAGSADVELAGDLTIHGVTQAVTVEAQVGPTADGVQVVGSVPITFSDFDVEAPSLGFVTVDDAGSVEFGLDLVPTPGS